MLLPRSDVLRLIALAGAGLPLAAWRGSRQRRGVGAGLGGPGAGRPEAADA